METEGAGDHATAPTAPPGDTGGPNAAAACASPRRRTFHGRPAHESPGTLRGQPSSASVARQRLGDVTNVGQAIFAHTPSPAPTIFELTPSPALHYRLRNIVSDGSRTLGCNAASSLHEATDPLTGAWSDQPATSAAATTIPPPNVLMSVLSSALRGPDSAQSLQQSLLIPRAPNSSSALATSVTAGRPPVPPRPLRKCCVCNEEKRTKFLCLTASWLKAAFVLLGRPFPGCFGTSSQACRFPTVHFRRDAFVCNDMLCV